MEQFCQDKAKIAIVGGGPAGVYCALNILDLFQKYNFNGFSITLFDKGQILRTILPTGGSRCNITNSIPDIREFASNYPRGEKFLYSLFARHFNYDSLEFFKTIGIETYIQDDGRVFPVSNSSKDVRDKMFDILRKNRNVKLVNKNISNKDELKDFDYVVIAVGSRGVENLLNSLKQPYIPFKKTLCSLVVKDFNFPVGVSVNSLDGDFLFTQDGISGPLAFKISSLNLNKTLPFDISINLFDYQDLMKIIEKNPKKSIGNLVSRFIPKSLARVIVDDFDKNSAEISLEKIKNYSKLNLTVLNFSQKGEIVNSGGIDLNSIDKNCKSKIQDNLWFCGEVLNIDGFCGGFNLQNCWSSGYVVANDLVSSIIVKDNNME